MSRTGLEPGFARPMSMRKLSEFTASEGSCKTHKVQMMAASTENRVKLVISIVN